MVEYSTSCQNNTCTWYSQQVTKKKTVIIPKSDHTQDALDEHQLATERRDQ